MPTILLVDDEEIIITLCSHVLRNVDGCDILQASDGNQALEVAHHHEGRIDLLLSDIVMEGGPNGIELAERVSGFRPNTKILLMSGYPNDSVLNHGCHFIAKPFLPATLLQIVKELLTGSDFCEEPPMSGTLSGRGS
jgi:CheY-like chemotaxis protein